MTTETWQLMVKVARRKLGHVDETTKPKHRKQRPSPTTRSVVEDHYMLLVAAQY